MTVYDAISAAEQILPGEAAPDGEIDPRWQAIIAIGNFIESDADEVWRFTARWGAHADEDLRSAIATCLLEHLLEFHFEKVFPEVEILVGRDEHFADTFMKCWKFGDSKKRPNAARLNALQQRVQRRQSQVGESQKPTA